MAEAGGRFVDVGQRVIRALSRAALMRTEMDRRTVGFRPDNYRVNELTVHHC